MAFFEWKDDYAVGVRVMDQQHKRLVGLVDELHQAMRAGKGSEGARKVLKGLVDYTMTHFRTEEEFMEKHSYPGFLAHKREHDDLTVQAKDLLAQSERGKLTVPIEAGKFLKDWLATHILGTDKKLGKYLVAKGLS
ncbi:MAG: bacteriohemerythrin [Thermodesulfobacteriota bacterium]